MYDIKCRDVQTRYHFALGKGRDLHLQPRRAGQPATIKGTRNTADVEHKMLLP